MNDRRLLSLRQLILAYRFEHDWTTDDDATQTLEMLADCQALLDELIAAERCAAFEESHGSDIGGEG